ncbi:MAG TPA: biopolymer transporter ExbD [Blastocatellia bacterium]|nr:biopolymer transporter ExbD [Blastocatellia bacterium]
MSDYVPLTPIDGAGGQPLPPQQSLPPPKKKSNVMVWVLAVCGTLIVIVVIVGLMQKNPGLAIAKRMVEANPDILEIVSVDDEKRLITMRNKQTSETFSLNMDAKEIGISIALPKSNYPEPDPNIIKDTSAVVTISQDNEFFIGRDKVAQADIPARIRNIFKDKPPPDQVVYIKSGKLVKYETVVSVIDAIRDAGFDRIGLVPEKESTPKLPDWFPSYPGAVLHETLSTERKDGESASFGFSTSDSIEKVMKFYKENLKQSGLKVTTNTVQPKGVVTKGSLATEYVDEKRTVFVTAISEKGQTQVTVVFASK